MKKMRNYVACTVLAAMVISTPSHAREYCTDTGGCAYEAAYESCCLAPAIALALVAIAGIIAVGVHNRSSSSHDHNDHCSCK